MYQQPASHRRTPAGARGAFTLIELLVVVAIIGILATMGLAALAQARNSARETQTRALIAKLDSIVMQRYASYRTRRAIYTQKGQLSRSPTKTADRRLNILRDLMRLEMPQRWLDVTAAPVTFPEGASSEYIATRPALSRAFYRQYDANKPTDEYQSAECLYMIVTLGSPELSSQFLDTEIGDVDEDGAREFLDGWGNPIMFLRWAPGVNDSDIQFVVSSTSGGTASMDTSLMCDAVKTDYDPFDSRKVDYSTDIKSTYPPRSWRLMPLIYSAGPDGIYDIKDDQLDSSGTPYSYEGNPFYFLDSSGDPILNEIGLPKDLDGNNSLDHYDNIHNHRTEAD